MCYASKPAWLHFLSKDRLATFYMCTLFIKVIILENKTYITALS